MLSAELGITFLILIYINKENLFISKSYIRDYKPISIIYTYSTEDILRYFSKDFSLCDLNFNGIDYFMSLNLIESNIQDNFDEETTEDYQDGCFDLAESFKINLGYFIPLNLITNYYKLI